MLNGFTIGGFRNFSGDPQWIAPLARVNIFIGANNSGKSNVLRFVQRVIEPMLSKGEPPKTRLQPFDTPRNGASLAYHSVLLPYKGSSAGEFKSRFAGWKEDLYSELDRFADETGEFLAIPIAAQRTNAEPQFAGIDPPPEAHQETWRHIWAALTHHQNGNFREHWFPASMQKFAAATAQNLECVYIPAFRQMTTRIGEFSDELTVVPEGDEHLIDQLQRLANPPWDQQEKKQEFQKLRDFLRELLANDQVEIEIPGDRRTINVSTGSSYLPIEVLGSGIHEVFMLAAKIVLESKNTILLEEPEVHLHPTLQRQLMRFIVEKTSGQFFITTHSSSVIDTEEAAVFSVTSTQDGAQVRRLNSSQGRFEACRELGYRASDLLQSNCVLWVEGPSDRIYLNAWIAEKDADLIEGIHYSIMFYGGKLLSRISLADESVDDFVKLLPINRSPAILIDSDLASAASTLRSTKVRVIDEMNRLDAYVWVTSGREIENYYSYDDRHAAIEHVHPKAGPRVGGRTRYDKPISFKSGTPPKEVAADKIAVATYLIENADVDPRHVDFPEKMRALIEYIWSANR